LRSQARSSDAALAKWFIPYVLVASLQYQFTKDGLYYSSPFVLMTLRYIFAGTIFYFLGGRKIPLDRDALLTAAFSSGSSLTWAIGLDYVSPGDSAILTYTMPFLSIPIAWIAIKERVVHRELLGGLIGFGGVVIYSLTLTHGSQLLGAFFTLVGAVFWGAYSVYYRKLRDRDPFPIFATQFLVGSIPGDIGCLFYPQVSPGINLFIDVVYIVVFTGLVQYVLWNALLRRGRVGQITTLAFAVPAMTVLTDSIRSFALPSSLAIFGGVIMFVGILISNWGRGDSGEEERPEDSSRAGSDGGRSIDGPTKRAGDELRNPLSSTFARARSRRSEQAGTRRMNLFSAGRPLGDCNALRPSTQAGSQQC
jgi:drug/metabolite transporter (DMT)-like permease